MVRILTFIMGLMGGVSLSQFPEFSQQYLQRLAGAVDELTRVVTDFDASASGVGMTREQALQSLTGGEFQQARQEDMTRTIARQERLSTDLEALRDASMVERALQPTRFTDPEIAAAAWEDFQPAVPVTSVGLIFAGVGFLIAAVGFFIFLVCSRWAWRKVKPKGKPVQLQKPGTGKDRAIKAANSGDGLPVVPRDLPYEIEPNLPLLRMALASTTPYQMVRKGARLQTAIMAIAPGQAQDGQSGDSSDLLLLCLEGDGDVIINGEPQRIVVGELMLLPPRTPHRIDNPGDGTLRFMAVETVNG